MRTIGSTVKVAAKDEELELKTEEFKKMQAQLHVTSSAERLHACFPESPILRWLS